MRSAAFLLALLCAGTASAEELPLRLPERAAITLVVEYSREDPGKPAARLNATYRSEVTRAGEGYQVSWRLLSGEGARHGAPSSAGPEHVVVFSAAPNLAPVRLENWPVVSAALVELARAAQPAIAPAMARTYAGWTPEYVADIMLKDAGLIAIGQNTSLDLNETIRFGEGPAKGELTLTAFDAGRKRAALVHTASFESDLGAVTRGAGVKPPPEPASVRLKQLTKCTYEVDAPTGLALVTDCVLTSSAGDAAQPLRVERLRATQALQR